MYNKILVPLDGSKAAEAVLPHVEIFARALQLPVDLVHVTDTETVSPSIHTGHQADYLKQFSFMLEPFAGELLRQKRQCG